MALSLEQYATYLDTRDLPWPKAPVVEPPKAKPFLVRLKGIHAILWNVYGTLLTISGGELLFQHPQEFVMEVALDKTIQEFKMWASMSRKPGQPSAYLGQIYSNLLDEQRSVPGGTERHPEINSEKVWEAVVKKLLQKDYKWDTSFYGALNELSRKIAYFFHASLQGTACFTGAAKTIASLEKKGLRQAILANGQCFSFVQLQRGVAEQDGDLDLKACIEPELCTWSYQHRGRKPSERLFRIALETLKEAGIASESILHIGSRLQDDIAPAKRLGMKTALFAGDKASLQAKPEQLKDATTRPDVMLTELPQLLDVIG